MKISSRGRYALRVMIELAENYSEEYIPLKEIAKNQDISLKYLEGIMTELSKNNVIDALHGKGGGYRLNRAPKEYVVGDILRITEGPLAPVTCMEENNYCNRKSFCKTLPMWKDFAKIVNNFFDNITIQDLLQNEVGDDYII